VSVAVETLLESTPGVCGGRLCIQGTRITVLQIAALEREGLSPAEIVAEYDHLTLAQVHAALAYCHANRDEIEADLADERHETGGLRRDTRFAGS